MRLMPRLARPVKKEFLTSAVITFSPDADSGTIYPSVESDAAEAELNAALDEWAIARAVAVWKRRAEAARGAA